MIKLDQTEALDKPEAKVVPTPLRLVRVEIACSTLGNLRKALRVSVCTAFGVLMRTRLVNCGKNFPRCKNRHSFFYNYHRRFLHKNVQHRAVHRGLLQLLTYVLTLKFYRRSNFLFILSTKILKTTFKSDIKALEKLLGWI